MTWEQTAEVLAREVDRLQKGIEKCIEWMDRPAEGSDFGELEEMLNAIVSPADEGGWAANCGESKPLVCHEMTPEETAEAAEIIRKAWEGVPKDIPIGGFDGLDSVAKAIVGGESQALQAAILGLHTLAGEFPTPTWKTREDYLQATISEINEILGKQ